MDRVALAGHMGLSLPHAGIAGLLSALGWITDNEDVGSLERVGGKRQWILLLGQWLSSSVQS